MTLFTIRVVGRPAPEGSHETGQHGHVMHSSAYLAAWRRAVQIAALRVMGEALHELPAFGRGVPVYVHSMCIIVGDEQCRALGTAEPVGPPDLDKLLRATIDGLGDGKVFENDSQVTKIRELEKRRALPGEEAGAVIVISDWPWADRESSNMQEYQLVLNKVTTDGDGDLLYSTMLEVCGTQTELGIVLPAVSAMLGLSMSTAGVSPSISPDPTAAVVETEEAKTKRTRRTKAEIEAAKAAEGHPAVQTEQAPELAPVAPAQRVNPFATPQA